MGSEPQESDTALQPAEDRREGVFLEGAAVTGGVIIGKADTVIQDPDAPYDVRGLPNPYLGLRSFGYDDRAKYAGRERLVTEALAALTAPGEQRALLLVTGASGSGKSSLAQAGLLPALEAYYGGRQLATRRAVFRPSRRPLSQLADALAQLGLGPAAALPADAAAIDARLASTPAAQVNLIVLDQFEELFSHADPSERDVLFAWLERLAPFATLRTHIIATMRSDFLPELFARQALYDATRPGLDLRAMTVAELQAAIQRPLQQVRPAGDRRFEEALLARLAQDASGDPAYLPLLQVTLEDLWSRGLLKLSAYGTLSDAIRTRAERTYAFADHEGACAQPRTAAEQAAIAGIFLDLVEVSPDGDARLDVRQRRTWDELVGRHPERVALVEDLIQMRLLARSGELRGDERVDVVDIVHETLIDNWQQLRGWIDAQRDSLRQRVRFEQALDEWQSHDRHADYLLQGVRLAEAEALDRRGDVALGGETARDFLRQSLAARDAARRAQLQRARLVAAGLGVLLLLAVAAAAYALQQARVRAAAEARVKEQLAVSDSQRLAFIAKSLPLRQAETALLLALEAAGSQRNPVTEQGLRDASATIDWQARPIASVGQVIQSARYSPDGQRVVTASDDGVVRVLGPDGAELIAIRGPGVIARDASFSPDGRLIVAAYEDGTARVWDLAGAERAVLSGHQDLLYSARFSPSGTRIATASKDGTARVWDLAGTELAVLSGHESEVNTASFSPDGQRIVTSSDDWTARVWDLAGAQLAVLSGHESGVYSARFSPDGQLIVTGSVDRTARLWRPDGQELLVLGGHADTVNEASFSPDGRLVVTASSDGTAHVWGVDGTDAGPLTGHVGSVNTASYSPDGVHILTGSADGTARVWSLIDPNLPTLYGHTDTVISAIYSPDGQRIATASKDGTAGIWATDAVLIAALRGHTDGVQSISYSADGQRIVTASRDRTARVWDLSGRELLVLRGHTDWVNSASFSPDGQRIVTASGDGTARVWDLSGAELLVLRGHTSFVNGVGFSPDGQRIVTASADKTARVWDLSGAELLVLRGHTDWVNSASFSPDGQRIVTASGDRTARVWDLSGAELLVLRGHENAVYDASFSPDSRLVVTASWDQTARIWDDSGREVATLRGHTDWVNSARFSPDGTRVVTASQDWRVIQHAVSIDDVQAIAACRVGRGLSDDEVRQYAVPTPLAFDYAARQCPPALSWRK